MKIINLLLVIAVLVKLLFRYLISLIFILTTYCSASNIEEIQNTFLTQEELEYVKNKKIVKVCMSESQAPFAIVNKNSYSGMSIKYLNEISMSTNLQFEMVVAKSINEYFTMLKKASCDMLVIALKRKKQAAFFKTSDALGSDYFVLVTKASAPYENNLNKLGSKKVAVLKGAKYQLNYIKSLYPDMNIVEVENITFDKILDGTWYGAITTSYKVIYLIATKYTNKLKIMSPIGDKKVQGSFGITNREPILLNIINKAIKNISPNEKIRIENYWKNIKIEKQFDYTLFFKVVSIFIVILLIVLYFYLKQKKLYKIIDNLNHNLKQKIELEVEKNQKQQVIMFKQSRHAQMGELLSMIAHQWRQPLSAIGGTTTNLKLHLNSNDFQKNIFYEELTLIDNYVQYLSTTIDSFRNFFKEDNIKKSTTLEEILEDVFVIINTSLKGKRIKIHKSFNSYLEIHTYINELQQVILNIMKNAEDALIDSKKENPSIYIKTKIIDSQSILIIKDNAGGIDEQIIDKVFDPYFSTKKEKNGLGLGLYMSKIIIEEHCKGKISVHNDNQGAVFIITIGEEA